jgi:hypothetical protein
MTGQGVLQFNSTKGTHELSLLIVQLTNRPTDRLTDWPTDHIRGAITRRFIIVFTKARLRSLSWTKLKHYPPNPQPVSPRSILMPSCHACHGLPSGFFPSGFSIFFHILLFVYFLGSDMLADEPVPNAKFRVTTPDWFIIFIYMQQAVSVYIFCICNRLFQCVFQQTYKMCWWRMCLTRWR